ncbi:hypothetical protein ACQ4M4_06945 [Leptolyngbya sp. AN02str]|uniref:hypothetical protein n=1 Tax=Leptolyngbya sp. AN02str TaxID=3423363 RepID=UPI003D323CF6
MTISTQHFNPSLTVILRGDRGGGDRMYPSHPSIAPTQLSPSHFQYSSYPKLQRPPIGP